MTPTRRALPVAVLLAVVGTGPAALADPTTPAAPGSPVVPATVDANAIVRSDVLAGYRIAADGGLQHRLTATVTVPTVDCTPTRPEPLIESLVLAGRPATDGGTDAVFVTTTASCRGTVAQYDASGFAGRGGAGIGFLVQVQPGDVLTFTATSTATRSSYVLAQGGRAVLRGVGDGFHVDLAQVVTQGGVGGGFPRPTAPVAFTGVRYDAAPLAAAAPNRLTQVDDTGLVLARAGALSRAGDAFTVRFTPPA